MDHGREHYLNLHVQDMLSGCRTNPQRRPVVQTCSTHVILSSAEIDMSVTRYDFWQNHTIERIWVEVNGRVNYPIKLALNEMNDADDIDLEDPQQQFAVSAVTKQVASHGCKIMVSSWNNHVIPDENAIEKQ